jgi:membrane-associated phospholipid phosphatase
MWISFKILVLSMTIFFTCFPQASDSMVVKNAPPSTSSTEIVLGAAAAAATTAFLIHYDQNIYDEIHSWRENNNAIRNASPVITNMGDGSFSLGLFGGFAGYGLIFKDTKAVEVGKIGVESFLLTGITVQLFKHLCGRERPSDATRSGGFWHGPFAFYNAAKGTKRGLAAFDAFPSGHTTTVFAAATTISDFYTEPWVSYTCYSLASLVAVSRVMERTHWLSDCFVGAIIGHYGTRLVEKLNYGSTDIALLPQVDQHQYGLLLSIKF